MHRTLQSHSYLTKKKSIDLLWEWHTYEMADISDKWIEDKTSNKNRSESTYIGVTFSRLKGQLDFHNSSFSPNSLNVSCPSLMAMQVSRETSAKIDISSLMNERLSEDSPSMVYEQLQQISNSSLMESHIK